MALARVVMVTEFAMFTECSDEFTLMYEDSVPGVSGGYDTIVRVFGTEIGHCESNTEKIVVQSGNAEPYRKKTDHAAKLCTDLVVAKTEKTYDNWVFTDQG